MRQGLSLDDVEDSPPSDLVLLAVLVSRVEATVLASMLEAAGIHVYVSGWHHASVEVNSLALGGHRLMVPASQYQEASDVIREARGERDWDFSHGLSRAVLKFLALWTGINATTIAVFILSAGLPASYILAALLAVFTVPVNPQGRGDFYLAPALQRN